MAKFHVEMLGNSEVPESWSIEFFPKSIDRFFPELTVAEARQNTQSGAFPWQKQFSLWFSQQNTLVSGPWLSLTREEPYKGLNESFYMGF